MSGQDGNSALQQMMGATRLPGQQESAVPAQMPTNQNQGGLPQVQDQFAPWFQILAKAHKTLAEMLKLSGDSMYAIDLERKGLEIEKLLNKRKSDFHKRHQSKGGAGGAASMAQILPGKAGGALGGYPNNG